LQALRRIRINAPHKLLRERLGIRVVSITQPMGEDPTDPSAFLAESIHEMFDEYYSGSLSFWTRTGLREKARQGHLVGNLPWGYLRDPESGIAAPEPELAPLVRELFERYATGQESDRSLAAWLNAKGARTARGRAFGKDTVRDKLLNSAYCGYVGGLRSKDRSIRGLYEPIVAPRTFSTWSRRSGRGGRAWSSRAAPPRTTCFGSSSTASAAVRGCTGTGAPAGRSGAITARPAAMATAAISRSPMPSHWRRRSSTGCAASSPMPDCGPSSSPPCGRRRHRRTTDRPGGATSTANWSGCGTST